MGSSITPVLPSPVVAPLAFQIFVADDVIIASLADATSVPRVAGWRISTGGLS